MCDSSNAECVNWLHHPKVSSARIPESQGSCLILPTRTQNSASIKCPNCLCKVLVVTLIIIGPATKRIPLWDSGLMQYSTLAPFLACDFPSPNAFICIISSVQHKVRQRAGLSPDHGSENKPADSKNLNNIKSRRLVTQEGSLFSTFTPSPTWHHRRHSVVPTQCVLLILGC